VSSQSQIINNQTSTQKSVIQSLQVVPKDTVKKDKSIVLPQVQEIKKDTVEDKRIGYVTKDAHVSYYADKFHGRRTASGAIFDMHKYTAAHKKFGTKLRLQIKQMDSLLL
jgi:rare lipoprotein A